MHVRSSKRGTVLVVAPQGLDTDHVPAVEAAIAEHIERGETRLVIDLSGVPYISSGGLRIIFKTVTAMMRKNGKVGLCGGNAQVLQVLQLSGGMVMALHSPGLDEAIEKLTSTLPLR